VLTADFQHLFLEFVGRWGRSQSIRR